MIERLTLIRESARRTSDSKLLDQLHFIAQRGLGGSRGRGWTYDLGSIEASQNGSGTWKFTSSINFHRRSPIDPDKESKQRAEIHEWASAAGHSARFAHQPWKAQLLLKSKPPIDTQDDKESGSPNPFLESEVVSLATISRIDKGDYFNHLYGLDSQIRVLLSAVQAAADSNMTNRFHSLLYGSPGCGKTDMLLSTAQLLSELGVSHVMIDATSATEAGIRKTLLDEDAILPQVIIIEEVEKCPENSLRWLLGVMDDRATISQHNYRRTASRKVPALILATANDYNLLKRMMYGALLSRFSNEIHCPRPNREILAKFLAREIAKVKGGNEKWIEPTLEFCFDKRSITDPRMLKRICLCGKDRLISGSYQKDLEQTMEIRKDSE